MILSLSIIGQERRARYAESLLLHPEVGRRRTLGVELLLEDLD